MRLPSYSRTFALMKAMDSGSITSRAFRNMPEIDITCAGLWTYIGRRQLFVAPKHDGYGGLHQGGATADSPSFSLLIRSAGLPSVTTQTAVIQQVTATAFDRMALRLLPPAPTCGPLMV
jgi:hypothetical protein